jgi:hypothetical protein
MGLFIVYIIYHEFTPFVPLLEENIEI